MTGYAFCMSPCISCDRVFTYNPHKVPSTRALTGQRKPICRRCMDLINAKRRELKLVPFEIHPDAYEPLPEGEL
jgi:hypothetical protein